MVTSLRLARLISAFNSALVGAKILIRVGLPHLMERYEELDKLSAVQEEVLIWMLMLMGLLCQFWMGFELPFVVRLVLTPAHIVENLLGFLAAR